MPSKTNCNCILGTLATKFIQFNIYRNNEISHTRLEEFINSLRKSISKVMDEVIRQKGISSVITEDQVDLATGQLMDEIILEPASFEKRIENIRKSELKSSKELTELKESLHVSSKLREIVLLEENPVFRVYSYLKLRALTVLKKYATDKSKEYFLLNNRIKRILKELSEGQKIFQPVPKHYSFNNTETALFQPRYCEPNMSEELSIELQQRHPNLKKLIKLFLKTNDQYLFNGKDIVKYFIPMFLKEPKKEKLVINNKAESEKVDGELEVVATETVKNLASLSYTKKGLQQEMAVLAYFYRVFPKYFSKEILCDKELSLSEIDSIEVFLNKKLFCHFTNSRKIGRTTACNRKNDGLAMIKNALLDFPIATQKVFLKKYCEHLEKRFIKLTGADL